MNVNVPMDI